MIPKPGPPPRPVDPADRLHAALDALEGLAQHPPAEHVALFEELHAALSGMLAAPTGSA